MKNTVNKEKNRILNENFIISYRRCWKKEVISMKCFDFVEL